MSNYYLAVQKLDFKKKELGIGPAYESTQITGDSVKFIFNIMGKMLVAKDRYCYITGFTIAGADKKKAKIEGNQVAVWRMV